MRTLGNQGPLPIGGSGLIFGIVQDPEDSNAQSVLKSLQSATPAPKTKAVPAIDEGSGKAKVSPPAAPSKAVPPKVDPPPPPIASGTSAQCESKDKGKS